MKCYGLIGRTLSHSFSKGYFTKKFAEEKLLDCHYELFEIQRMDDFPFVLASNPCLNGLNVTIPYKEEVLQYLTAEDEIVKAVGACNCIKIDGENLVGYNTDVFGFRCSLERQLQSHHKKALILGTGGASKAIRFVLDQMGIGYHLVSRVKKQDVLCYEEIDREMLNEFQLIINTTPVGMYPMIDNAPSIPYEFITPRHFLFDLIYNPAKTTFLLEGEKRGAQTSNGYEMLVHQAEESWRIWNR